MSPRGGKRAGAGRPAERGRRVALSVRVEQITRYRLEEAASALDLSLGEMIDALVEHHRHCARARSEGEQPT